MTTQRIAAVKAALQSRIATCDAATPAPWVWQQNDTGSYWWLGPPNQTCPSYERQEAIDDGSAGGEYGGDTDPATVPDWVLIADSRNNRPAELAALLAMVEQIEPHLADPYRSNGTSKDEYRWEHECAMRDSALALLAILETHLGLTPKETE